MTVLFPEATPSHLNEKVVIVDAIADPSAPDLSSELTELLTLDISCFIRAWNPEQTTNTGSAPDRLCSAVTLPQEGKTTISAIQINYVYDPQASNGASGNEALAKLQQGGEYFVVVRKGLPYAQEFEVDQRVEVWKVRCGRQNRVKSGDDEFAEFEVMQMLFPVSDVTYGEIVA